MNNIIDSFSLKETGKKKENTKEPGHSTPAAGPVHDACRNQGKLSAV